MVKALTVFVVHGPSDGPVIVLWVVTEHDLLERGPDL